MCAALRRARNPETPFEKSQWAIVYSGRESAMDRELAINNAESGRGAQAAYPLAAAQQRQTVSPTREIA
jgi:hypothetical protein